MSTDAAGPSEGELDVLLDALMPRLVARLQHAFDRIRWTPPSASSPSSTSSSSSSSALSEVRVEQLVRAGVADGLQQLLSSLRRTSSAAGRPGEDGDEEEEEVTSGMSDPDHPPPADESQERVPPPSMRLLGDVSLQPRTVVGVAQPLMKVWLVHNTGEAPWPEQLRLLPAERTPSPFVLESDALLFTNIAPDAQLKLSVPITTPTQAGRHVGKYNLAYYQPAESKWLPFGDALSIDLTCRESTSASTAAASASTSSFTLPAAADDAAGEGGVLEMKRKRSVEERLGGKATREEKEAAIAKKIVDTAVGGLQAKPADGVSDAQPAMAREGEEATTGSGEGKAERRKKAEHRLRVEKGKDRSASVDSKPPTLTSDWYSLVTSDAKSATATVATVPSVLTTVGTQAEAANLLSTSPRSAQTATAPADDRGELDWLNDANTADVALPAPLTAPPPSTAPPSSTLRPFPPPHLSKSATHSRSNSPALPPQPFAAPPPAAPFSRSISQSFPLSQSLQAQGGGELLSPPLTPTAPHSAQLASGRSAFLSKDDLMSWAGGHGLSVTNKQTGLQSQAQQPLPTANRNAQPSPAPLSQASTGQAGASSTSSSGAAGGIASSSISTSSTSSSSSGARSSAVTSPVARTRHSLPPAAGPMGASGNGNGRPQSVSQSANATSASFPPPAHLSASASSTALSAAQTAGASKHIPTFLEQAAWMQK